MKMEFILKLLGIFAIHSSVYRSLNNSKSKDIFEISNKPLSDSANFEVNENNGFEMSVGKRLNIYCEQ